MMASLNSGTRLHESQSPANQNQQYRRKSNKRMRGAVYQNENNLNLTNLNNQNEYSHVASASNSPKKT
jgi:hypothetical protein